MKPLSAPGFTLIELMVTVAIVAITLTLGVPSLRETIRSNRLAASANRFVSALSLARSEAVKRGMPVTVGKTSANWENGWQVFTDNPNAAGKLGTQEGTDATLQVYPALPAGYTLRGNNNVVNYISFLPSGEGYQMGSLALCDSSANNGAPCAAAGGPSCPPKYGSRLLILNRVGRVRLGIDRDHNGIPEKEDGTNLISCANP